jgi:hypothetical protein
VPVLVVPSERALRTGWRRPHTWNAAAGSAASREGDCSDSSEAAVSGGLYLPPETAGFIAEQQPGPALSLLGA